VQPVSAISLNALTISVLHCKGSKTRARVYTRNIYGWPEPYNYRYTRRVGQNRIYTPYITVYMAVFLPKILYIHRIYICFWPTLYIRCTYVTFREITIHTVIYGADIRFWSTLEILHMLRAERKRCSIIYLFHNVHFLHCMFNTRCNCTTCKNPLIVLISAHLFAHLLHFCTLPRLKPLKDPKTCTRRPRKVSHLCKHRHTHTTTHMNTHKHTHVPQNSCITCPAHSTPTHTHVCKPTHTQKLCRSRQATPPPHFTQHQPPFLFRSTCCASPSSCRGPSHTFKTHRWDYAIWYYVHILSVQQSSLEHVNMCYIHVFSLQGSSREHVIWYYAHLLCVQGWPEPYIYTVYDCIFGVLPAKNTVYTPCTFGSGQPCLCARVFRVTKCPRLLVSLARLPIMISFFVPAIEANRRFNS
jgi:hypothetical protein